MLDGAEGDDDGVTGAQVESLIRGIESGMKQSDEIYRVDVVPIGRGQADGPTDR